jgi:hypothetical protein
LALASAMPLDPPVMTATLPSSFPIIAPFVKVVVLVTPNHVVVHFLFLLLEEILKNQRSPAIPLRLDE